MNVWTNALVQADIVIFISTILSVDANALKLYPVQLTIISMLTPAHANANRLLAFQAMLRVPVLVYVPKNDCLSQLNKIIMNNMNFIAWM